MKQRLILPDLNNQPKCKSIVSENIDNVIEGKALTAPLSFLNNFCEFQRVWDMINHDDIEKDKKELAKKSRKKYYQKTKEYWRERKKQYQQRPEVKAKKKEYYQRPEVKAKKKKYQKKYQKEYYQRPEVKAKKKKYYQRKKLRNQKFMLRQKSMSG